MKVERSAAKPGHATHNLGLAKFPGGWGRGENGLVRLEISNLPSEENTRKTQLSTNCMVQIAHFGLNDGRRGSAAMWLRKIGTAFTVAAGIFEAATAADFPQPPVVDRPAATFVTAPQARAQSILVFGGRLSTSDFWSAFILNVNDPAGTAPNYDNFIVGASLYFLRACFEDLARVVLGDKQNHWSGLARRCEET